MANYKPYPKYKNSNIPWLGEIPEHWEKKKVKYQFNVNRGRVIPNTDLVENGLYPVFSSQTKNNGLLGKINSFDFDGEYISWTTDGVYAGTTFVRKGKFNATNICGLLKSRIDSDIDYLGYLFSHITPPNKRPDTNGAKIMSNEMKNIFFILPPIQEQTAIARFLDYKLAKINRFIQKKKQLIKLLNEQKAAIINQAVTKGLDPNTKMKDSGIEWLGEIPEHWEVTRAKYLGKAIIGLTYSPSEETDSENGILVLRSSNVQNEKITFDDCVYVTTEIPENKITRLGDILICSRNGSIKLIGKNALIDEQAEGLTFGAFMTIFRSPNYEFLHYFFNSASFKAQSGLFTTSTINQLTTGILNNIIVAIPKLLEEQLEIVEFIKNETEIINTTISKIEKEIALVEEYKTALIAEAVTGKIDVRGYEVPEISEEETYEDLEEEISITSEDAEAYQTVEE